jgi:hypothetical protein
MSSTLTITGTVTDAAGVAVPFTATAVLDSFTVAATVTPQNAPAGTTRTLTVTATGGTAPFTFGTPVATGITFTPVSGQPGQWTFVY